MLPQGSSGETPLAGNASFAASFGPKRSHLLRVIGCGLLEAKGLRAAVGYCLGGACLLPFKRP